MPTQKNKSTESKIKQLKDEFIGKNVFKLSILDKEGKAVAIKKLMILKL